MENPVQHLAMGLAVKTLRRLPRYGRPHRLDFLGAVLVMAASSCFMLALNLGGMHYPWLSVPVLALLGAAPASWAPDLSCGCLPPSSR